MANAVGVLDVIGKNKYDQCRYLTSVDDMLSGFKGRFSKK